MYVKQAIDGTKDKHVVTDKETGEKYQKYGHMSDCFVGETVIMTDCGEKTMRDIEPGNSVLTRNGYRKVIAKQHKGLKIVNTYQIGDRQITCTDEHKIFANWDFIMVSALIDKNIIAIFARKEKWKEKLFSWMGLNFTDTQNRRNLLTGAISKVGLILAVIGKRLQCIVTFGRRLMVRFQKALQYIISTVTSLIIELKIYILSVFLNIWHYIINYQLKSKRMQVNVGCSNWPYLKQWNGINQRLVRNGIGKISLDSFLQKNTKLSVLIAENPLNQIFAKSQNIVQENANSNIKHEDTEQKGSIMNKESAKLVENNLQSINGIRISSVRVPVFRIGQSKRRFVYDITVEQEHEFFANGILVHNCADYLMVELFKTYYNG